MALPKQVTDKNNYASGFFYVGTAYSLTNAASVVFDTDAPTCILIVSDGCEYEVGTNPTGAGTNHQAPAGAFPLAIPAGEKVYISGTAGISVIA